MSWQEALGWIAYVLVVVSYAASIRTGNARVFHWGNVIGAWGIGISAVWAQAWPSLAITVTFGGIGLWGLLHRNDSPS